MYKHNIKNFIKCNCLHVRKWVCGLLAAQIILLPNYSFAQINPDITVQQMNNSFGVSAFDLTNYNLALNLNFGNKNPDTTYGALTAIYRGLAQAFGPAYYYEIQSNTLNSPARYSETQNVLRSLQAIEQNQWYMNQNLISSDSSLSNISSKLTTNNSLLTTQNSLLYDYNHVGDASYSLGSTSKNTAVNTLNIYNLLNTSNWISASTYQGVSETFGGQFVSTASNKTNWSVPDLYWYFDNFNIAGQNFFRVTIPTRAGGMNYMNAYIDYIEILDNNGRPVEADYLLEYDYMSNRVIIYFLNYVPFVRTYPFVVHIHYAHSIDYFVNQDHLIQYLPYDSFGYLMKSNNLYLRDIANKEFTAEISGDVNVDTSSLEDKVDQIIDSIDDLSLTNNDVKLNLNINNNTGSDGSNIIGRLQNFFSTGTSISDFFDNVDDAESGWFTQTNSDLINTLSGGYVNLYE